MNLLRRCANTLVEISFVGYVSGNACLIGDTFADIITKGPKASVDHKEAIVMACCTSWGYASALMFAGKAPVSFPTIMVLVSVGTYFAVSPRYNHYRKGESSTFAKMFGRDASSV